MIGIVFKASADIGEKFAMFCNPAECHPPVSFPSPLLKKCSLFNDFPKANAFSLFSVMMSKFLERSRISCNECVENPITIGF
ncbi:hypothetical protein TNCV_3475711 [Trichonephila clavipes]|nr:hypothetical protein TNCV_3475711 [Trichonephila clavipes]